MARYKKSCHCLPAWDWQKATVTPRKIGKCGLPKAGRDVKKLKKRTGFDFWTRCLFTGANYTVIFYGVMGMVEKTMENIEAQTLIQRGFTLIEIISVLVILGVLAAVAVPKYIDLQRDAQNKALLSVKSEAQARMNLLFSQNVMNGKTYTHSAVPTDTMCQKMWFSAYNNFTYGSGGLENVGENMTIGSYLVTLSPLKPNYSVLKVAFLKDDKNIVPQGVDMTREPWIIKSPCEE